MASGTLGQSAPVAVTNTTVYTVPAATVATFNVNITNRGTDNVTVRLAIASAATPTNSEYLEFDAVIASGGVLERTGIMASAGERVVVYASNANTSVNVYGYED